MESSAGPAAGWFADPADTSLERWWSGYEWTEYTRQPPEVVAHATFATPPPVPAATPIAQAAPLLGAAADPVAEVSDNGAGRAYGVAATYPAFSGVSDAKPLAATSPEVPAALLEQSPPMPATPIPVPAWLESADPAPPAPSGFVLPGDVAPATSEPSPVVPAPATPTPVPAETTTVASDAAAHASAFDVPAAAPAGYAATADPDVAGRYRAALGSPVNVPPAIVAGAAYASPLNPTSSSGAIRQVTNPRRGSANPTSWIAFSLGVVALALVGASYVPELDVDIWPAAPAALALLLGIVGLIRVRTTRRGVAPSILGILFGLGAGALVSDQLVALIQPLL